tara:strand:- start:7691 stop:9166 length:1476 start_codon:yes stop_codon:yes gene_type:complete
MSLNGITIPYEKQSNQIIMANNKLRGKDLSKLGYTTPKSKSIALDYCNRIAKHSTKKEKISLLEDVLLNAEKYKDHDTLGKLAAEFIIVNDIAPKQIIDINKESGDFNVFGREHVTSNTIQQMSTAMRLPIAEKGALMPDAHVGYGLPIGGVLASKNHIIPYGVGVDIGCRMSLSIYDVRPAYLDRYEYQLSEGLIGNTAFGSGNAIENPRSDDLFDRPEFKEIPIVKSLMNKAIQQIGSSGSGNHFVEFGKVVFEQDFQNEQKGFNIPNGEYVGILSHSGSRGFGAGIAQYYTRLAKESCLLPREVQHLAWLDIHSEAGAEYWMAMNLAGDYAKACHDHIHYRLGKLVGGKPIAKIENHHNFAWKEKIEDQELIVHRKGATPAHKGELGVIPGSMIHPGYIVSGKGEVASLNSASHGAGRELSRTKAKNAITRSELKKILKREKVTLIGGGVDEAPIAYKNIDNVIKAQKNLINIEGKFYPRIVRMDKER